MVQRARLRARDGRSLAELAVDYTVSRTVASGVVVGAASVAEDNILQVWRPADDVVFDDHARAATKRQRLD